MSFISKIKMPEIKIPSFVEKVQLTQNQKRALKIAAVGLAATVAVGVAIYFGTSMASKLFAISESTDLPPKDKDPQTKVEDPQTKVEVKGEGSNPETSRPLTPTEDQEPAVKQSTPVKTPKVNSKDGDSENLKKLSKDLFDEVVSFRENESKESKIVCSCPQSEELIRKEFYLKHIGQWLEKQYSERDFSSYNNIIFAIRRLKLPEFTQFCYGIAPAGFKKVEMFISKCV